MEQLLVTSRELQTPRSHWRVIRAAFVAGLTAAGLAFCLTWLVLAWPTVIMNLEWWLGDRPATPQSIGEADGHTTIPTDRLVIAAIGVDAPVFYDTESTDAVGRLADGVVHARGTAAPGEAGNSVYFGHSAGYWWQRGEFNQVFSLLDKLDLSDEVLVNRAGATHVYRVVDRRVVKPSQVEVLDQPTDQTLLTLITCTPVGTTLNRLIVRAELVEG